MKYTLITGGSGFIGSRIINKFNKNKIKINLKRKKNNTFYKNHNIINLDFSKKNLDFSFLKNINTVIHCASLNKFESENIVHLKDVKISDLSERQALIRKVHITGEPHIEKKN